ncbi:site-specific DNA-methyltransferase, partial [Salmonella enterica subsp. enterica serovar Derby]
EDPLPPADLAAVARSSAALACFEYRGDLLAPLELPQVDVVDEDLVTIPKYRGKTNEQFTRLLLNLTLASLEGRCATRRDEGQRLAILDPLAGRGTTLECAWRAGHNGFGVEQDAKAVEALAAHVTTWLRRKHLKH